MQFVGVSDADESPIEPGVYIVPAHATMMPPPSPPLEGETWVWKGNAWEAELLPIVEEPEPEEPPVPMDLLRAHRNNLLTRTDWRVIKAYSQGEPVAADWAAYMQALRNLPSVSTPSLGADGTLDMASVEWPVVPV